MWGFRHHDLRSTKSVDYRLTPAELTHLKTHHILIKKSIPRQYYPHQTFRNHYLDLYNNNMPVFITSDSLLFALHKFYDNFVMYNEQVFMKKLDNLSSLLLNCLSTIILNEQNMELIKGLELFFAVIRKILTTENHEYYYIKKTKIEPIIFHHFFLFDF